MQKVANNYYINLLNILSNAHNDQTLLNRVMGISIGGDKIERIAMGGMGGDLHRQGKTVAIIEYSSGSKVVYKPRAMALEQSFQNLLKWFEQQKGWNILPMPTMKMVDNGSYGYTEFVNNRPCKNMKEVENFI